jgi:hypothetical protein
LPIGSAQDQTEQQATAPLIGRQPHSQIHRSAPTASTLAATKNTRAPWNMPNAAPAFFTRVMLKKAGNDFVVLAVAPE